MGLAEKRAIKEFQEQRFEKLCGEIRSVAGVDVPVNVQWDTLAEDGMSHLYGDAFEKVYFSPIIEAFKGLCNDDLGKEAVVELVKEIEICNTNQHSNANGISLAGGKLTVDHKPTSNIDDVNVRVKGITQVIESAA